MKSPSAMSSRAITPFPERVRLTLTHSFLFTRTLHNSDTSLHNFCDSAICSVSSAASTFSNYSKCDLKSQIYETDIYIEMSNENNERSLTRPALFTFWYHACVSKYGVSQTCRFQLSTDAIQLYTETLNCWVHWMTTVVPPINTVVEILHVRPL